MEQVAVRLDEETIAQLDTLVRVWNGDLPTDEAVSGYTRSDVIRDALRRYLS